MTKGSCGKEPCEIERLMHGSEVAAGEGIPLPTITGHVAGVQCSQVTGGLLRWRRRRKPMLKLYKHIEDNTIQIILS
jgi:hypothetical protein